MPAKIEPAAYRLTGISKGAGNCDACAREITRVFEVRHKETEATLLLGRRCAAKATGYKGGEVERQARIAARLAECDRRKRIIAAEFPALAAEYERWTAEAWTLPVPERHEWTRDACMFQTVYTEDALWPEGWRDYLTETTGEK